MTKSVFELREANLKEMAPPHVERDEVIRQVRKRGIQVKRRESSRASNSEYATFDVGDEHDEYGEKIGDKLLKVRFSDHPDRRRSSAKFAPADVEVGRHGLPVHHAIKHILRHAGINESKSVFDIKERTIMYHGTREKFDNFDISKAKRGPYGRGIYTTNDHPLAKQYSGDNEPMKLQVHLKKPYHVDLDLPYTHLDSVNRRATFREKDATEKLQAKGHDGVLVKQGKYREAVVFDPKSVKKINESPTTKQHINYQMLSNYSLGQRVRYNDQLAAFEVARRRRMIDHQIQHHPSMRMMPTQSRSETLANPEVLGKKTTWVREKIDVIAEQYGYPKDKIFMSDEQYSFSVGDKSYTSGGVAYINDHPELGRKKGDIVIYGKPNFENDLPIRGIMAHEISHHKFDKVMSNYHKEYMAHKENPDDKPTAAKYPITAVLLKTKLLTGIRALIDSDGVSPYSLSYWNDFYNAQPTHRQSKLNRAIDETIAEIARLDEEVGIKKPINPAVFYKKATIFLNNHFKERFEKHGEVFATKDEYDYIQRDPWAYLDMADTEDFKKEFGVYPRSIRVNHIQKRVTVQEDPFFKPAKVKPEWVKLYKTINELYEKLKDKKEPEMPEYPYDGAHSR